jgi:hypothetical protein
MREYENCENAGMREWERLPRQLLSKDGQHFFCNTLKPRHKHILLKMPKFSGPKPTNTKISINPRTKHTFDFCWPDFFFLYGDMPVIIFCDP